MSQDEKVDGPKAAAAIISRMEPENQTKIVANIELAAPAIAEKISDNMFRFDDIAALPDRGLQVLAQSVNHLDLVLALKKARSSTKERILENVSERKRTLIIEDSQTSAPESEIAEAQRRVLATLDELRTTGKIQTAQPGDVWVA